MEILTKMLYWISTGLLIPVVILLLVFFFRALILMGAFYGLYIQRLKFDVDFNKIGDTMDCHNIREKIAEIVIRKRMLLSNYVTKLASVNPSIIHYEKLLDDFEIDIQKDLAGAQTLSKLGPVLGLMGTLIPMGPALVGLAAGDISTMASNMQVAFATTVVGLLCGAIGFVLLQVKRRWYKSDLNKLTFMVELMMESITQNERQ